MSDGISLSDIYYLEQRRQEALNKQDEKIRALKTQRGKAEFNPARKKALGDKLERAMLSKAMMDAKLTGRIDRAKRTRLTA